MVQKDGKPVYTFVCKQHPSKFVTRHALDKSTSNLNKHLHTCEPGVNLLQPTVLQALTSRSTYTKSAFWQLCVKWIVRRRRPFSIIDDPELHAMFQMLNAKVEVPNRQMISRDIVKLYKQCLGRIQLMLKEHQGAIHIGLDTWTSHNLMPMLGITVHLVHEGQLHSFFMDFIYLN